MQQSFAHNDFTGTRVEHSAGNDFNALADGSALRTHAAGPGQVGLCVHGPGYETVSSTILALSNADPGENLLLYADGSPCTTPYRDYREVVRRLPSPD